MAFESKFEKLEQDEKIDLVCLVNDLQVFCELCYSTSKFSKEDVFNCLSMIRYDLQQLEKKKVEITPDEILGSIMLKNKKCEIPVEQLTQLINHINNKLLPKKYFDSNELKKVCEILGITPPIE